MKKALGLVEIKGLATAILVADTMAKTANITITQIENTRGLGWMTVKITGDVGAVTAAINAGTQMGVLHDNFVSAKIIPRPSDLVETYFCHTEEEIIKKETIDEDKKGTLILEQKEEIKEKEETKEEQKEDTKEEQKEETKEEIEEEQKEEVLKIEQEEIPTVETDDAVKKSNKKKTPKPKTNQ